MNLEKEFKLRGGIDIPSIGVGTFKLRDSTEDNTLVFRTLNASILAGYRLIDTASVYRNEKDIGIALKSLYKQHSIEREHIFITSKLSPADLGYTSTKEAFMRTLDHLDCDYLDLYLIHWPAKSKLKPEDEKHKDFRKDSWMALEELQQSGVIKSIGVSNYTIDHLKEMETYATTLPFVNQVEFHPHLYQKELLSFCSRKGIFLQAYSSLGTGQLMDVNDIKLIADKYNKSPAQVLLYWALRHYVGVLPKSINVKHIKDNIDIYNMHLNDDDMNTLDNLNINKHYCWDPTFVQ